MSETKQRDKSGERQRRKKIEEHRKQTLSKVQDKPVARCVHKPFALPCAPAATRLHSPSPLLPANRLRCLRPTRAHTHKHARTRTRTTPPRASSLVHRPTHPRQSIFKQNSEFMCRPKFRNTLPDVPFAPKFLAMPSSAGRFCRFTPQALEKAYKWTPHAEPALGVHIDLVAPENAAAPTPQPDLPPEDARLLQEDGGNMGGAAGGMGGSKGGKTARNLEALRPNVTWLKKTIYLGNDLYKSEHSFVRGTEEKEAAKEELDSKLLDSKLTDSQALRKVRETFQAVKRVGPGTGKGPALKHATKPELTATEVWPILPSFEHFPVKYTQVDFDTDPTVLERRDVKRTAAQVQAERAAKRRRVMRSIVRNSYEEPREGRLIGSFLLPRDDPAEEDIPAGGEEDGASSSSSSSSPAGNKGAVYDWKREFELSIRTTKDRQDQSFVFLLEDGGKAVRFFKSASRLLLKRSNVPLDEERKGSVVVAERSYTRDERLERHDVLTHLDRNLEPEPEEEEEEEEEDDELLAPVAGLSSEKSAPAEEDADEAMAEAATKEKDGQEEKEEEEGSPAVEVAAEAAEEDRATTVPTEAAEAAEEAPAPAEAAEAVEEAPAPVEAAEKSAEPEENASVE